MDVKKPGHAKTTSSRKNSTRRLPHWGPGKGAGLQGVSNPGPANARDGYGDGDGDGDGDAGRRPFPERRSMQVAGRLAAGPYPDRLYVRSENNLPQAPAECEPQMENRSSTSRHKGQVRKRSRPPSKIPGWLLSSFLIVPSSCEKTGLTGRKEEREEKRKGQSNEEGDCLPVCHNRQSGKPSRKFG